MTRSGSTPDPVLDGLRAAAAELETLGVPVPPLAGKLLRPVVAWASVPPEERADVDRRFWLGALAVQMVHEASLLHDDILDDAAIRRGRETVASRDGIGPALVTGDHWLTGAYRAAAMVGSPAFMDVFTRAVERTVAGEVAQGRAAGRPLDLESYEEIVRGKSGELFGAVVALPAALAGRDVAEAREVGLRLGALYQKVDDFLDYCPDTDQGKPPLQDFRQGKWTWVLDEAGMTGLGDDPEDVLRALHRPDGPRGSAMARCVGRLRLGAEEIVRAHAAVVRSAPDGKPLAPVVDGWLAAAARGLAAGIDATVPAARADGVTAPANVLLADVVERARAVGGPDAWMGFFGHHARTFRFASRLFPGWAAQRVAEVYAFCRFTDDLADEAGPDATPEEIASRLEIWRNLARRAWAGEKTGIPLLDVVMGRMGAEGVPFDYADALVDGVASDAGPVRIADGEELELYTWRVASVVGGWLTRLFGVHDEAVLARAHRLGHAMQLTNILRDVGDDWRSGRVYLPRDLLDRHGVDDAVLAAVCEGGSPVPDSYRAALAELMVEADRAYDAAMEAVPALPAWYGRPVAVAARAYQAIHDEIRRNGWDNGTRRAHTSLARKAVVGVRALFELRRLRREARTPASSGSARLDAPAGVHG